VRLGPTGAIDHSFTNGLPFTYISQITRQNDGRFLVLGGLQVTNGSFQNRLVRLGTNGQVDPSFQVTTGLLTSFILTPDQRIVVLGWPSYPDTTGGGVLRLDSSGQRDQTFQPDIDFTPGAIAS